MKKSLILILLIVSIVSFTFISISCKGATSESGTVAETAATAETAELEKDTSTEASAGEEEITLRWTDYQAGNTGLLNSYNELMQIFYKDHPNVKIDYQQYSATTYEEFLKPALSGGQAPDMFFVIQGYNIVDIASSGALRDLTNDIDDEWKSWLGPAYNFQGAWYEDKLWAIPQDCYTECIWYHKDMLQEIGFEPKQSTDAYTVEEFISMVEPAKAKGYDVMLAGFSEIWCYHNPFFNFVHQQQESDLPDMVAQAINGDISWQQDIFRNAINVFVQLNNGKVWRQDALNMDYQIQAFGKWIDRESIFLWAQGDWFASAMKEEENNADNPNIGIIQYPLVSPDSTVSFNKNMGTNIAVSANGKHQDLCLEWIRLTSSPEAAKIFMKNGVNPAAGVDTADLPEITNPVLEECIKLYNSDGRPSEIFFNTPKTSIVIQAVGDGIGEVLLNVSTVDDVLANLDELCKK